MKRKLILFTVMLLNLTVVLSQKKVSVKTKAGYKKFNYFKLPELVSDSTHITFKASFSDETGRKYSYGNGKFEVPALSYIWKLKMGGKDYEVEVQRLESEKSNKQPNAKKNKYNRKDANGVATEYYLSVYECFYNQKFKIIIKDNMIGGKVIYENEVTFETTAEFPNEFGINKLGYSNEAGLKTGFSRYVRENREKFENIAKVKATIRCYNTKIKDKLNDLIAYKKEDLFLPNNKFKTKDDRFSLLDSTSYYFKKGLEQFNLQKASKVYVNAHSIEIYNLFSNNYRIFKQFDNDEICSLIYDVEERETFKYAIKTNLFASALLTSRYEEAILLFKQVEVDYKEEQILIKEDAKMIPSLKVTNIEKCYIIMESKLEWIAREKRLYESHKVFFSFYK